MVGALLLLLILTAGVIWHLYIRSIAEKAEGQVPRVGKMHKVRGGQLHYLETGKPDGPTLVMLHGLSGQLQHFSYGIAPELEDSFRLILVDRPGCGYSRRDGAEMAPLAEQARMVWELLDDLGVKKPVLVGHSLGGALSLRMAVDRPDDVGALALLCPATQEVGPPEGAFAPLNVPNPIMRRLLAETIVVPAARKQAAETLRIIFAPEPWPEDFITRGGGALGLRPQAFVTASEDVGMMEAAMKAQVPLYKTALKAPGGVLFGAEDAMLKPDQHGAPMAEHGFDVETLDGAGHMIPITAPAACADFIRRMAAKAT